MPLVPMFSITNTPKVYVPHPQPSSQTLRSPELHVEHVEHTLALHCEGQHGQPLVIPPRLRTARSVCVWRSYDPPPLPRLPWRRLAASESPPAARPPAAAAAPPWRHTLLRRRGYQHQRPSLADGEHGASIMCPVGSHLPPQPLHQHLVRQRRPRVHLLRPVPRQTTSVGHLP
jgi:hypothetical protein